MLRSVPAGRFLFFDMMKRPPFSDRSRRIASALFIVCIILTPTMQGPEPVFVRVIGDCTGSNPVPRTSKAKGKRRDVLKTFHLACLATLARPGIFPGRRDPGSTVMGTFNTINPGSTSVGELTSIKRIDELSMEYIAGVRMRSVGDGREILRED